VMLWPLKAEPKGDRDDKHEKDAAKVR
jgi:hypothetical protein